jgi:hypothetical protein
VSVLNGTGVPGRADEAAGVLRRAGYRIELVATAPEARWTDVPAVIAHGDAGTPQAALVASQIPGSRTINDLRSGRDVEVVVGTGFATLGPAPRLVPVASCGAGAAGREQASAGH